MTNRYNILKISKRGSTMVLANLLCLEMAIFSVGSSMAGEKKNAEVTPKIPQNTIMPVVELADTKYNPIQKVNNWLEDNELTYTTLLEQASNSPEYKKLLENFTLSMSNDSEELSTYVTGQTKFMRDTLYIGDSRTQGLLYSGAVDEDHTVYGVGYGYKWFTGSGAFSEKKTNAMQGAIKGIEAKMENGKSYNIAIWLGVNDLNYVSAEQYFEKYVELATGEWKKHDIYVASVGPVIDSRCKNVKNRSIDAFNTSLKKLVDESGLKNLHYVDLKLTPNSIVKFDGAGLHYSKADSHNIQSLMIAEVERVNGEQQAELIEFFAEFVDKLDQLPNRIIDAKINSLKPLNLNRLK